MSAAPQETIVRMGEYAVARGEGSLVAVGLGSCVAVILHDRPARIGGMAHVVLPAASLGRLHDKPARSVETAIPVLIGAMTAGGASLARIVARLIGGASMFANLLPPGSVPIGERNVLAARVALRAAGIAIVGEEVGDSIGRSVSFDVARGSARIRSVGRDDRVL